MIKIEGNKLIRICDGEKMLIEPWGKNSLRVRVTRLKEFSDENWALLPQEEIIPEMISDAGEIINGKIRLKLTEAGKILIYNDREELLLGEYEYNRHSCLYISSRELKGMQGGLFRASMKWQSDPEEKLYGMGQYQNGIFNLKGTFLELAQRNSQASVPFVYSSLGYGFLWNNPAIGKAAFGMNMTEWEAECTKQIDFWITAGDTPKEILSSYMEATGKPPVMPEHGLGFWQCKLRYQTQEELLEVAREYHRRGIPLNVIVIDFYHWTIDGTWAFDMQYWPDPTAMVKELKEMGIEPVVSVWPTVAQRTPGYEEMQEKGYLVQNERGVHAQMMGFDPFVFTDVTNPDARKYLWSKIKENYVSHGITNFWLDLAEPEFIPYDYENFRYYKGSTLEVGNEYPAMYTKTFWDGLKEENVDPISLVRCAWAGSQRYGALVWSGDIPCTFESFKVQIVCGLQMAMAGIPWWTTDIGGFVGGNIYDPAFQELLVRWFQYGTFCPVMRMHGFRLPAKEPMSTVGGGRCSSGADNEIWSYGEANYEIMKRHIEIREKMRPYLRELTEQSSEIGCPLIRPLFYNFPEDSLVWDIKDAFLLGDHILVAPVTEYQKRVREVYLPAGTNWVDAYSRKVYEGGKWITADAPIEKIPVFIREEKKELTEIFA